MFFKVATLVSLFPTISLLASACTTAGLLDFKIPNTNITSKTYYKIIGDLKRHSRPLIALHGGPGLVSGSLEILSDITESRRSLGPLIVYDQIGNGLSSHFPERMGDTAFWTEALFIAELENLIKNLGIKEFDLLGHSWGGMMGSTFAASRPAGLKHLILMSSPASMPLWVEGVNRLRKKLPKDVQTVLDEGDKTGDYESEAYQAAVQEFYKRHLIRIEPVPEKVMEVFEWVSKDPTVYLTMNGPTEFTVLGSLKDWTVVDKIPKIKVPTLVTNGAYDEATDTAIEPFVKKLPNVKWVKFQNSSHMAHWEQREEYMRTLREFLYKD